MVEILLRGEAELILKPPQARRQQQAGQLSFYSLHETTNMWAGFNKISR